MKNRTSICVMLLTLMFSGVNYASSSNPAPPPQSNLINGVSKFLVERADDNFLYILQTNMKKNPSLEKYTPETFKYIRSNNLFILLKNKGNGILKDTLITDIKNLPKNVLVNELDAKKLSDLLSLLEKTVLQNGEYIVYTREITENIKEIASDLKKISTSFSKLAAGDKKPEELIATFLEDSAHLIQQLESLNVLISNNDHCNQECRKKLEPLSEFTKKANKYAKFSIFLTTIYELSKNHDEHVKTIYKIDIAFQDYINKEDSILDFTYKDIQAYNQFMRYLTIFALISEPSSEDEVTVLLKSLAMPPVSFFVKREPHAKKALITAYFGLQGGYEGHTGAYGGMAAPLGVEFSKSFSGRHQWGAVSLLFAPLDFAHPINKLIDSSKTTMRWEDIFVPGAYISYAVKDYPIVLGIGLSYGSSLNQANTTKEWRGMMFIGMDMPLFNLYR